MFKRKFERLNADVSILGFGAMRLPETPKGKGDIDTQKAFEMIDYAIQNGVNYFDTAWMYHYGKSEQFLKKGLVQRYKRSDFYVADKFPAWDAQNLDDVERIFETQKQRLGVDYFDFYLCHAMEGSTVEKFRTFILDFLLKKRDEGVIKRLGFSFHNTIPALKQIVEFCDWDFAQIQLNYLDWYEAYAKQEYDILTNKNIPIIVMEPVRGGMLANPHQSVREVFEKADKNRSIASWAIRFAMSHDNILTVLSGMSNLEQVKDNIYTAKNFTPMSQAEFDIIKKAVDDLKAKVSVPCTGCNYCMDCPFGVDIPKMFSIYNKRMVYNDVGGVKRDLQNEPHSAALCKSCNKCVKMCPQRINIPEKLKMIASL